jgi:hypothetical protein
VDERTQANPNYSSGATTHRQHHDSSFSHFNSYQKPASKQGQTLEDIDMYTGLWYSLVTNTMLNPTVLIKPKHEIQIF